MRYDITHTTTYDYSETVSVSHHVARLRARRSPIQTCLRYELAIDPVPAVTNEDTDYFGNAVTNFTMQGPHQRLQVVARSAVEVSVPTAPPSSGTPPWEDVRDGLAREVLDGYEFVFDSPLIATSAELAAYAAPSFAPQRPMLDAVVDLTRRIHDEVTFDPKATSVTTPLHEVFRARRGVCQDFAHLEIACLRALGLAARYVSGYLETTPPPNRPRLVGADASHAWVGVYCPGPGWIDVDPTNNLVPADRHVTLAWGRDYSDVSPIRGVILGGGDHRARVAVDVVQSSPR